MTVLSRGDDPPNPPVPPAGGTTEWNVMVPMRDGTLLAAAIDFGPGAETDLPALEREWLAWVLRKEGEAPAPVRLFVMGDNAWRAEQEWPLARTR